MAGFGGSTGVSKGYVDKAIAQSTAIVDASASNITVASGAFRLDLVVTVPSGYTIVGVLAWNFGARVNVSITGVEASNGYVRIYGINNGASITVSPTAKVLCVKQ